MGSGLVVFIVSLTGCLYVFGEDIKHTIYKDRRIVNIPENTTRLPLSNLLNIAERAIEKQYPCQRIIIPNFENQSVSFIFENADEVKFFYPNYMEFYKTVYVNPYTGNVIAIENTKWEFLL